MTDLANSFYLHRNVYTYFLCTQKILSVCTYMVPTYFTINSILILFLEENKKMLQNISHQPQNYKSTWWTQSKSFKPVLPHTKPSTFFTKDKIKHCTEITSKQKGMEMQNREQSCWLFKRCSSKSMFVGYSGLLLMFYFNWYFTDKGAKVNTYCRNSNYSMSLTSSGNLIPGQPDPPSVLMQRSSSSTLQDARLPPAPRRWQRLRLWSHINLEVISKAWWVRYLGC